MGFLSKPFKTSSYQSWTDIGGKQGVVVQKRTTEGILKNQTLTHRFRYSAIDLFTFRILVCDVANYVGPTGDTDHALDNQMEKASKYVIAATNSKNEITADWNRIKDIPVTSLTSKTWPDTYQQLLRSSVSGASSVVSEKVIPSSPISAAILRTSNSPLTASPQTAPRMARDDYEKTTSFKTSEPASASPLPVPCTPQTTQVPQHQALQSNVIPAPQQEIATSSVSTPPPVVRTNKIVEDPKDLTPCVVHTMPPMPHGGKFGDCAIQQSKDDLTTAESVVLRLLRIWDGSSLFLTLLLGLVILFANGMLFPPSAPPVADSVVPVVSVSEPETRQQQPTANIKAIKASEPTLQNKTTDGKENGTSTKKKNEKASNKETTKKPAPPPEPAPPSNAVVLQQESSDVVLGIFPSVLLLILVPLALLHPTYHPSGSAVFALKHKLLDKPVPKLIIASLAKQEGSFAEWTAIGTIISVAIYADLFSIGSWCSSAVSSGMYSNFSFLLNGSKFWIFSMPTSIEGFLIGSLVLTLWLSALVGFIFKKAAPKKKAADADTAAGYWQRANPGEIRSLQSPPAQTSAPAPQNNQKLTSKPPNPVTAPPQSLPEVVQNALTLLSNPSWKSRGEQNNVVRFSLVVPWCKAEATLQRILIPNVHPLSVMAVMYDDPTGEKGNQSYAFQVNDMLESRTLVKRLSTEEAVWHQCMKSVLPGVVAPRDFVASVRPFTVLSPSMLRSFKIWDDGGNDDSAAPFAAIYTAQSWHSHDLPESPPGSIRGLMHRYAVLVVQASDRRSTELSIVSSIDSMGNIPMKAVELAKNEQCKQISKLISTIVDHETRFGAPEELPNGLYGPLPPYGSAECLQKINDHKLNQATAAAAGVSKPPKQKKFHQTFVEAALPKEFERPFLFLLKHPDWKFREEKHGVQMFEMSVDYCPIKATKHYIFLPGVKATTFFQILYDDSRGTLGTACNSFKFDRLLKTREFICPEAITNETCCTGEEISAERSIGPVTRDIWYLSYKSPLWGIAERDFTISIVPFVLLSRRQQDRFGLLPQGNWKPDDCPIVYCYGAMHTNRVKDRGSSKICRGQVHDYAIIVQQRQDGSGCDVTVFSSSDLGGSLPISIVNAVNVDQLEKTSMICTMVQAQEKRNQGNQFMPEGWFQQVEEEPEVVEKGVTVTNQTADVATLPPELPVDPMQEKYLEVLPIAATKAFKLWKSGDWALHSSDEETGGKLFTKPSPFCDKRAVWATVFIPGRLRCEDFENFCCDDPNGTNMRANAYTYDTMLERRFKLRDISEVEGYWRTTYKTPMRLVAQREMVTHVWGNVWVSPAQQAEWGMNSPVGRVFCQCGVDASDVYPPETGSSYQRGAVHAWMMLVEEHENGLQLSVMMSVDPCGSIPAKFIDMSNKNQLGKVLAIRKMMMK